jgi:hypothetical protein
MPVEPKSQTLTNGRSQQFNLLDAAGARVGPAGGGAVQWTFAPATAGASISPSGVFTAPAVVAAESQVVVTATPPGGVAEGAVVRLVPLEIVLAPAKVSLREGETQRFDAKVPGDPANAVEWNIAPGVGTILGGLYTAPTPNTEDRKVQVIVTSAIDPHKTATATVKLRSKLPRAGVTVGLFVYLVAIFSLVVLLISLWPPAAPDDKVSTWFGEIAREVDYLWLVLITGALGSFAYGARSFVDFVGNRALRASWSAWYLMYPFIGAALALIFYLAVRGGFLTTSAGKDVNVYGMTAISGLVGMFSKQATTKLSEVFANLFKTDKDDKNLKDSLADEST